MSVNFNGPAAEIFQILRSYNYEVVLYDDDGNQCYEPEDARRFFCKPTNMLMSLVDDGDNSSMRLFLGQDSKINQLTGLIDTCRSTAPKYNMLFNVRKYNREITPKDFATKASVKEAAPFDINKVTKDSLDTLPGIGLSRAKTIVKGRPWKAKATDVKEERKDAMKQDPKKWDTKRDSQQRIEMPAKKMTEAWYDDEDEEIPVDDGDMDDDGDGDDILQDPVECPVCGGAGELLGSLGSLDHFRCRNCGIQFNHETPGFKESACATPKKDVMKVFEGMYGTTLSSYIKLENARMIVRHKKRVNEDLIGSRGRNIEHIFIENAIGERTLFPVNNLSGARAMTQHVNQGGSFGDTVGSHIMTMAEDFANLATASRYIRANGPGLAESAYDVRNTVREAMKESRRMFERMFREGGYRAEAAKITERANTLVENDDGDPAERLAEQVEQLRGILTVEGVELSANVYESVAKALHEMEGMQGNAQGQNQGEAAEGEIEEDGKKNYKGRTKAEPVPMVEIKDIGWDRGVSKAAWEKLKAGEIDVSGEPQLGLSTGMDDPGPAPSSFKDARAELVMKLSAVADVAKDDTMFNLLSYAADQLAQTKDRRLYHRLKLIGVKAVQAAGVSLDMQESATLVSPVIREYNDWIAGHSPEAVLMQEEDDEEITDEEIDEGPQFNAYKRSSSMGVKSQSGTARPTQSAQPAHSAPQSPTSAPMASNTGLATGSASPLSSVLTNEEELDEAVPLGTPQTITFTSDLRGREVTVTATNHPAVAGENPEHGEDQNASLVIDSIVSSDGGRIDPETLDPQAKAELQSQAVQELANRVGDDDFTESEEMDEDEWSMEEALMSPPGDDQQTRVGAAGLNHDGMTDEDMMSLPSEPAGEVGSGGQMGGCDELEPNDVILPNQGQPQAQARVIPTNMGRDLENEIRVTTTTGDDGQPTPANASYIERLLQLAGRNRY